MNENLSDYLHGMPIYIFWWLNVVMVHLLVAILHGGNFMWSWTTRLAWFYFHIYKISQLDEFKLKSGANIQILFFYFIVYYML